MIFHCLYMPHFAYSFMHQRTFGLFPSFGYVNNTAMIMGVPLVVWIPAFNSLGYKPHSELVNHMLILYVSFCRTPIPFATAATQFYIPTSNIPNPRPCQHVFSLCVCFFFIIAMLWVVCHGGFDLDFPNDYWWASFHKPVDYFLFVVVAL